MHNVKLFPDSIIHKSLKLEQPKCPQAEWVTPLRNIHAMGNYTAKKKKKKKNDLLLLET